MSSEKPTHEADVERAADPLLGRRRLVDVRCEFAERARLEAEGIESKLADAKGRLETARTTMEQTEVALDADTLAAAKEAAHRAFRKADRIAEDRAAVEAAASTWLAQINRVNRAARAVRLQAERQRRTVAKLEEEVRRLSHAAEAARTSADLATDACIEARDALAAGEAARAAEVAAAAREPVAPEPVVPEPPAPEPPAPEPVAAAAPPAPEPTSEPPEPEPPAAAQADEAPAPQPVVQTGPAGAEAAAARHRHVHRRHEDAADLATQAQPGGAPATPPADAVTPPPTAAASGIDFLALARSAPDDEGPVLALGDPNPPAVITLLAGNRATFSALVGGLGSGGRANEARWRILVSDFVDAVRATAIDAGYFDFPENDPFWGLFSNEQAREITRHLAALGYRYDGMTGFADGRIPGRRELSLAVGNAGLNPIRIRHWPERDEIAGLFRLASLATDQLVVERAPSLSLAEVTRLLGRRAEQLGDLWADWDRVRALLLERR